MRTANVDGAVPPSHRRNRTTLITTCRHHRVLQGVNADSHASEPAGTGE